MGAFFSREVQYFNFVSPIDTRFMLGVEERTESLSFFKILSLREFQQKLDFNIQRQSVKFIDILCIYFLSLPFFIIIIKPQKI